VIHALKIPPEQCAIVPGHLPQRSAATRQVLVLHPCSPLTTTTTLTRGLVPVPADPAATHPSSPFHVGFRSHGVSDAESMTCTYMLRLSCFACITTSGVRWENYQCCAPINLAMVWLQLPPSMSMAGLICWCFEMRA
jgi:hypothetical protein